MVPAGGVPVLPSLSHTTKQVAYITLHFKYKLKSLILPDVIKVILEVAHILNRPNYILLLTLT